METAVDAGRRSASGNGGDLLQTPDVSIGQRRTHFAHGCRLQVEAKAQLVCSSARPLVHCGGFGFGFLERGEDGPVAKHGKP